MPRIIAVAIVAVMFFGGVQWRGTAQQNATLEERVAELEADERQIRNTLAELLEVAIYPAPGLAWNEQGQFTDLSALSTDIGVHYSVCRVSDLTDLLTTEGFDSLPALDLDPWAQAASGIDGYMLMGCARVD